MAGLQINHQESRLPDKKSLRKDFPEKVNSHSQNQKNLE